MSLDPNAGKPATPSMLVNVPRLITAYYTGRPDPAVRAQRVAFGTSGHRGSRFALSDPAWVSALEVLAANGVDTMIDSAGGYTPTPTLSHAILTYNKGRADGLADGIVITPSHNPPEHGGFKYNPPNGGPADTGATRRIEDRANELLEGGLRKILRMPYEGARKVSTTHRHDYVSEYVNDLASVLDMDAIRGAKLNVGVDPLGGAGIE